MSLSSNNKGLGKRTREVKVTSKAVQEERLIDDDANPCRKTCNRLSITDLPDDFLSLVYQRLESSTNHSSFGLVCRHWLHIQNDNHESLWDEDNSKCSLRKSSKLTPTIFSIILCKLLIRFQHLKRLFLNRLPVVTDYIVSQSHLFGSKVEYICLDGFAEYSDKKLFLIFSSFPGLASVGLNSSQITDTGIEVLEKCCASLEKVDLRYCQRITNKGLTMLVKNCASLKKVDLAGCQWITDKGLEFLAKSLEEVDIRYCQSITNKGLTMLAKNCASLKKVDLAGCHSITNEGLAVLAKNCASLGEVNLRSCQWVTDKGLEVLAKSRASLEVVNLRDCQGVTDSGISFLIQNCSKIRSVEISFCANVTGVGFLGCSKTLTYVDATFMCKLTTVGIKAITSGGGIESLNLSGKAVNNEAVITISKSFPLLRSLSLEYCLEVGPLGWKAIGLYCRNLTELYLANCPKLCVKGVKALCYGCNKLSSLHTGLWSDHDFALDLFRRERPEVHLY
ncbi:F-box/LRR-repeat protein 12-like [Papaver somniferum]|uniref:F-box/LRR-repeat protein 12-like n=1 Tax=Papaver somniferum TaxID=3469 RepID=UPI000E70398D|nr:F-box/LRR-repeat protein 12-like [Papaver somniferum]